MAKEEEIEIKTIDINNFALSAIQVKKWLEEQSNILVIFDDIIDYDDIAYLMPEKNQQIIITSVDAESMRAGYSTFKIENFTEDETQEYLVKTIGHKKLAQTEQEDIELFIACIGTMPLKLARACGYIQRNRKSIKQFLELYEEMKRKFIITKFITYSSSISKYYSNAQKYN